MSVRLREVTAGYAEKTVLRAVSLALPETGALAVTGPSGCGKTTLLYVLSGLLAPWSGTVEGTKDLRVSMAFQEDRLLPWCTALENVCAALPGGMKEKDAALAWLSRLELEEAANRYPAALSGGMRRRVALARALAYGGDLLLLDEPFNGLDEALRERIAPAVKSAAPLVVLVTHSPKDALLFDAAIWPMQAVDRSIGAEY